MAPPAHPMQLLQRAASLYEGRQLDEAAELCEKLLALRPVPGDVAHLAGLVAFERGDRPRAIALLRQALKAGVRHPGLHANLAVCLVATGEVSAAIEQAGAALRLSPAWALGYAAMSDALLAMGAVPEAMQQLRRSLEVASAPEVHSNLLYAMNFVGTVPRKEVLQEHRAWGRAWGEAAPAMPHANAREPERRLRVGYLSADMRLHSVAYFLAPLLAAHDRAAVEVHGFPSVRRPDATTERLRGLCDGWTPVHALSDADAAAAIRDAGIDVLVELGGHTGQSRLRVLAHRPAPVQVSWLGYPNTTGLDAVGFRLTDAMVDPEGDADAHHVEKLWRLPSGFLCYEPPPAAPDVGPPPSAATGTITFGSFNTLAKTSPRTIELWARILRHVEGSRLVLKSGPLADAGVRQRVTQLFAQQGVDAARLVLDGRTGSLDAHLARYGEIDVALDPFPYNGTTTTCEALWMGVPVVALEGDRHVARVSASILRRLGLDGLVASTPKDYQAIATGLARDRARLAELRRGMRERMRGSPLGDGARFAREVEQAYRAMWRAWCA